MRGRGPRGGGAAPGLDHHHRLDARRGARCRHELARTAHRLDVQQDGVRVRIAGQVVQQVAEVHVGHITQRHQVREADPARLRPVDDRGHHRARLGDEGQPAGARRQVRKARVQMLSGHHQTHAVGSDDAQQMGLGGLQHGAAQGRAVGVVAVLETRRDDHGRLGAAGAQFRDQARHRLRRRGDHGQVRCQRQAGHVLVGQHALHRHVLRIDRHHRPVETGPKQVARQHGTDRARPGTGADQRHRFGFEQVIEVADGHGELRGWAVDARTGCYRRTLAVRVLPATGPWHTAAPGFPNLFRHRDQP